MLRSVAIVLVLAACAPRVAPPPPESETPAAASIAAPPATAPPARAPAPAPAASSKATGAAPAETLRPVTDDFAVVPTAASIYRAAAAVDELRLDGELGMLGARARDEHYQVVGELRASDGELWVELETKGWDEKRHCTSPPFGLDDLALRIFVRRSELALVVSRELRNDRGDGTWIALHRGAVVTPSDRDGHVRYAHHDGALELAAPTTSLGTRYRPEPDEPYVTPDIVLRDDAPADAVKLGDGTVIAASLTNSLRDRERVRGKRSLVGLESGCLELRALVADRWIAPQDEASIFGSLVGDEVGAHVVRAGAPLYWSDGSRAGTTRADAAFTDVVDRRGGRVCLSRPRHGTSVIARGLLAEDREPSPPLILCAAEADLEAAK